MRSSQSVLTGSVSAYEAVYIYNPTVRDRVREGLNQCCPTEPLDVVQSFLSLGRGPSLPIHDALHFLLSAIPWGRKGRR